MEPPGRERKSVAGWTHVDTSYGEGASHSAQEANWPHGKSITGFANKVTGGLGTKSFDKRREIEAGERAR